MSQPGFFALLRGKQPEEFHERRRSVRTATVFQVAKLSTSRFEELCVLRDVSPSGLKAEVYCPLAIGDLIRIELKTEHSVSGEVVWARDGMIGVHFDAEVPILAMLAHCAFDDRLARIRPPRLTSTLAGTLFVDKDEHPVNALNVSLAGLKISLEGYHAADTRAFITLPGLARRACSIRWTRGGEAGILLDEPLAYPEFATWRRQLLGLEPKVAAA